MGKERKKVGSSDEFKFIGGIESDKRHYYKEKKILENKIQR